jgi:hypothetical protein
LLSEAGDDKNKTKNGFKNSLGQRQIQKGSKPETLVANPTKLFTAVIYNFFVISYSIYPWPAFAA